MAWVLKRDDENKAVLSESGEPVFVDGDDEATWDEVNKFFGKKITDANREAKDRRLELRDLKGTLEQYQELGEDIDDIKARLQKADDVDLSQLVKADEVKAKIASVTESLAKEKAELKKALETRESELKAEISKAEGTIHQLVISNGFAKSPLFTDPKKTLMDPIVAEKVFGDRFRVVDGKPVCCPEGWGRDGKPLGTELYSETEHGELAGFNEALDRLWDKYPHRDRYTPALGGGDHTRGGTRSDTKNATIEARLSEAQKRGDVAEFIRLEGERAAQAASGGR